MKVLKFGSSAVATAEKIKEVAKLPRPQRKEQYYCVVGH